MYFKKCIKFHVTWNKKINGALCEIKFCLPFEMCEIFTLLVCQNTQNNICLKKKLKGSLQSFIHLNFFVIHQRTLKWNLDSVGYMVST